MICPFCNQEISDQAKFCTFCGKKIVAPAGQSEPVTSIYQEPASQDSYSEPAPSEPTSDVSYFGNNIGELDTSVNDLPPETNFDSAGSTPTDDLFTGFGQAHDVPTSEPAGEVYSQPQDAAPFYDQIPQQNEIPQDPAPTPYDIPQQEVPQMQYGSAQQEAPQMQYGSAQQGAPQPQSNQFGYMPIGSDAPASQAGGSQIPPQQTYSPTAKPKKSKASLVLAILGIVLVAIIVIVLFNTLGSSSTSKSLQQSTPAVTEDVNNEAPAASDSNKSLTIKSGSGSNTTSTTEESEPDAAEDTEPAEPEQSEEAEPSSGSGISIKSKSGN